MVTLLLGGSGLPASAQQLAYAIGYPSVYGRIDLHNGENTTLNESANGFYTSDGQYGMRRESEGLLVWHVPSGARATIATDFAPWFPHPRHVAMFGLSAGLPARLDADGLHTWPVCAPAPPNTRIVMDLSGDGATLVIKCGDDLVSVDTTTGGETHRLALAGIAGAFALNQDGSEVTGWRPGSYPATLVRLDLATGAVLSSTTDDASPGGVWSTPRRDRVVASTCRIVSVNVVCSAWLSDAAGLTTVRGLGGSDFGSPSVTISPDGHDAFVQGWGYAVSTTYLDWIDVDSGTVRARISMPTGQGGVAITLLPLPLPPVSPSASVAGTTVTLSWLLPAASPQATGYRLDVGTAPGATNLGSFAAGAAESFTATGVPPGRYYVRIRALNYTGVSTPSNEIVVDVP